MKDATGEQSAPPQDAEEDDEAPRASQMSRGPEKQSNDV